jgi:uncharacterized protein (TIGR03437 family)
MSVSVALLQMLFCYSFADNVRAQDRGPSDALANQIDRLNHELAKSVGDHVDFHLDLVRGLLVERRALLSSLMELDASRALALALPRDQVDRLQVAGHQDAIESTGEWAGVAEVAVADDFERRQSRVITSLKLGSERIRVYFADSVPSLKSGDTLHVHGMRLGAVIAADEANVTPAADSAACSSIGQQNIAVLLVNMPNAPLPSSVTPSYVSELMFGTGQSSIDKFWREVSYGKASATGKVFGPLTLSQSLPCYQDLVGNSGFSKDPIISSADAVIDLTGYNRIVVIDQLNDSTCPAAYSTLGCADLTSPLHGAFKASEATFHYSASMTDTGWEYLFAHELGHSLGINHATTLQYGSVPLGAPGDPATFVEYGDPFSVMSGGNNGHYAAPHKYQLGWFSNANVQTVEAPGTFVLQPFESTTNGVQALRVKRGSAIEQYLWVEYRQPIGYDANFNNQPYTGAIIHLEDPSTTLWQGSRLDGYTYLLDFTASTTPGNFSDAALTVGTKWTDPSSSLTLTVNSATASGLSLTVNYDSPCVTVSPSSLNLSAGVQIGTISVVGNCASSATTATNWITITGGSALAGSGTVTFSVAANATPMIRTGTISVGRQLVTMTQASAVPTPTLQPASGASAPGEVQQFDLTFYGAPAQVDLLFSKDGSVERACWVHYWTAIANGQPLPQLDLYADNGLDFAGASIPPFSNIDLHNSQCTVHATSVQISGNTLVMTISLGFSSSFMGSLTGYGRAWDGISSAPPFQPLGSWTVGPQISAASVFNAASSLSGGIAPNEFISIYGSGLGPSSGVIPGDLSTLVSGTRVIIAGTPAYLTYVSASQINALVPYGVAGTGTTTIQAEYNGVKGNAATIQAVNASPGVFTQAYGAGQAWVVDQDGTFNSAANAAPRNTYVSFWATGQGLVDIPQQDGAQPAGPPFPKPLLPVSVNIGGVRVPDENVTFVGLIYAGEIQVNVLIPSNAPTGNAVPLVLNIDGASSRTGVTMAIK